MKWHKLSQYIRSNKGKRILFILPLLCAVGLVIQPLIAAFAYLPGGVVAWNVTVGIMMTMLTLIMNVITKALTPLITGALSLSILTPNYLLNSSTTLILWGWMWTVANTIYFLVLTAAAIAIVARLNIGTYNIKKVLGSFITAVVLTNFSFYIVKALVGLGDLLIENVFVFTEKIGSISTFFISNKNQLLQLFINLLEDMKFETPVALYSDWAIAEKVLIFIITLVILWLCAKLALLFLERMFRLFMATVTAPIIFAVSLLPNFQKAAAGWWETTIKWIIVMPITIFVIALSLFFFSKAGLDNADQLKYTHLVDKINIKRLFHQLQTTSLSFDTRNNDHVADVFIAANPTPSPNPNPAPKPQPPQDPDGYFTIIGYFWFTLALFTLYMAGSVGNLLKLGSIMTGIVDTPQKLLKPAQGWAGKLSSPMQKGFSKWLNPVGRITSGIKGKYADMADQGGRVGKFEQWRGAQTGTLGQVVNAKVWGEQQQKRREKGKEQRDLTGSVNRQKQLEEQLDNAATTFLPTVGKKWADLTDGEKQKIYANNGSIKKTARAYDEASKLAKAAEKKITKSITKEDIAGMSATDLEKDLFGKDPVKQAEAFASLNKIARDRTHGDSNEARAILARADIPSQFSKRAESFKKPTVTQKSTFATAYQNAYDNRNQLREQTQTYITDMEAAHGYAAGGINDVDVNTLIEDHSAHEALNNINFNDINSAQLEAAAIEGSTHSATGSGKSNYQELQDKLNSSPNASDADLRQTLKTAGVTATAQDAMITLVKRNVSQEAIEIRNKIQNTATNNGQTINDLIVELKATIDPAHNEQLHMNKLDKQMDTENNATGQQLSAMALNRIAASASGSITTSSGKNLVNPENVSDVNHDLYNDLVQEIKNKNLSPTTRLSDRAAEPKIQQLMNDLGTVYGLTPETVNKLSFDQTMQYFRVVGKNLDKKYPRGTGTKSPWDD